MAMTGSGSSARQDWTKSFVALGSLREDSWVPSGAGVLLVDPPVVWLVTLKSVVDSLAKNFSHAWVARQNNRGLLDLGRAQEALGLGWVSHSRYDIAATLFPLDPKFDIKAFSHTQSTMISDVHAAQPVLTVGCMYGPDVDNPGYPAPAVYDGIVARSEVGSQRIYTTALMFPRNAGGPLVVASQYGGPVSLAGIMVGNVMLGDTDPRVLPVRVGSALAIDSAWELVRSEAAVAQRQRAMAGPGAREASP